MLKITSHSPDPWKGYFGYHLLSSWFITSLFPIFHSFLQLPIISSSPPTSQSSAHPKSSVEEGALVSVTLLSTSEKSRDWPHSPQSDQTAPRPAGHLRLKLPGTGKTRINTLWCPVPLTSSYILCSNGRVTCWTWFHGPGHLEPLQQCGGSRLLGGWNWEIPNWRHAEMVGTIPERKMEICSWENHETQWWLFQQAMVDEKRKNTIWTSQIHHVIHQKPRILHLKTFPRDLRTSVFHFHLFHTANKHEFLNCSHYPNITYFLATLNTWNVIRYNSSRIWSFYLFGDCYVCYLYMHTYIIYHISIYTCINIYMYILKMKYAYVYIYICVCVCIYMYACIYIYIYTYIDIDIYIYTDTYISATI